MFDLSLLLVLIIFGQFLLRLMKPAGVAGAVASYRQKAETKIILDMAARCWGQGIPWNEALKIAETAQKRIAERVGPRSKG